MTKPPSSERGLYRRGIRWISRYIPHFFVWIAAHSIAAELLLFFSLAFTVHIVNAISLGEELVRIQGRLVAFLLTMFFFKACRKCPSPQEGSQMGFAVSCRGSADHG